MRPFTRPGRTLRVPVIRSLILPSGLGYGLVTAFFYVVLEHDLFRKDVLEYWNDSLLWLTPFNPFHVPGYPLAIALVRGLTRNTIDPLLLMMLINLAALLLSVWLVYRILCSSGVARELALLGAVLFAWWPFVGLVYAVIPIADLLAAFLLLLGIRTLQSRPSWKAAIPFGLALITHKATWPFVALIFLSLLLRRAIQGKQLLAFTLILLVPIGALWVAGAQFYDSVTWLYRTNLQVEIASRSALPILDGMVGTFGRGTIIGVVKGLIVSSFFLLTAALAYLSRPTKDPRAQFRSLIGLAICLPLVIFFIILNQHEIWAAVRFSRLLVLPLIWAASDSVTITAWLTRARARGAVNVLLLTLLTTQFVYAWYVADVFYS